VLVLSTKVERENLEADGALACKSSESIHLCSITLPFLFSKTPKIKFFDKRAWGDNFEKILAVEKTAITAK
jgi:hypothetical protein